MVGGSIRVALLVGNAVRATEANGPLCDLHSALTGCDNSAQWDAKRCSSNDMFARCCQPNFGPFGSGCASRAGGDSDISLQDGISNPVHQSMLASPHDVEKEGWVVVNSTQDHVCHNGVSVPDHLDAVRPT